MDRCWTASLDSPDGRLVARYAIRSWNWNSVWWQFCDADDDTSHITYSFSIDGLNWAQGALIGTYGTQTTRAEYGAAQRGEVADGAAEQPARGLGQPG